AIARFRLLTTSQLTRIVSGSRRGISNRLRILVTHKLLVRLNGRVTEPFAYGLATKGAQYLANHGFPINPRVDWTAENSRTDNFRMHTLNVAETMLHFDRAVREHAVTLLDHHEIHQHFPAETQNSKRRFFLRVPVVHKNNEPISIPVAPDRLFALI